MTDSTPIAADTHVSGGVEVTSEDLSKFERVIRLADTMASDVPLSSASLGHIRVAYETLGLARHRLAASAPAAREGECK